VQHRTAEHADERVRAKLEGGDDAEVPSAAAERPEQVGLAIGVDDGDATVRENWRVPTE
jgi:hypothetical protein